MRALLEIETDELNKRVELNEPGALFEKGMRAKQASVNEDAKKYLFFAMQLGYVDACYPLGEIYADEGDGANAIECFKEGKRGGDELCAFAYAAHTLLEQSDSLEYITNFANEGDKTSIVLLTEFYQNSGNKRQAEYWRKKGNQIG